MDAMDSLETVRAAKAGDGGAFGDLVAAYERRVFGYFMSRSGDAHAAAELSQDAFVKACLGLRSLRDAERFGPWLFAICRNELRRHFSENAASRRRFRPLDEDSPWRGESPGPGDDERAMLAALASLGAPDRELIRLRYWAGLSVAELAAAAGCSPGSAKGRLHRARLKLARAMPGFADAALVDPRTFESIKENVMENVEMTRRAARVFARLSLSAQAAFAAAAAAGTRFGEALIASLGAEEGGREFLADYGPQLGFRELINILNLSDRYVEGRLIRSLDSSDPDLAERIKRHMFVFEDLSLFDPGAMAAVAARADPGDFAAALAGTWVSVRERILGLLPPEASADLRLRMAGKDPVGEAMEEAQLAVITIARELEQEGRLAALRETVDGRETVVISLR